MVNSANNDRPSLAAPTLPLAKFDAGNDQTAGRASFGHSSLGLLLIGV
jgi:hypothetical protein